MLAVIQETFDKELKLPSANTEKRLKSGRADKCNILKTFDTKNII